MSSAATAGRSFEEYVPPLPTQLIALLASARLCDLSCQDGDDPPHTSLMNFSFIEDEQDIIVVSRDDPLLSMLIPPTLLCRSET